jgi:hypothetical protein
VPGAGLPLLAEIAVVDQPNPTGGSVTQPGAANGAATAPGTPAGATSPTASGQAASLPAAATGGSVTAPVGSSDESVDTSAAQRAAQQASSTDTTKEDVALVAVADATGEQSVVCPAGVAPGSSVKRKDASGAEVTVKCK